MIKNKVIDLYYDWLLDQVCDDRQKDIYNDMLRVLYDTDFIWSIARDKNRADDGKYLRYTFGDAYHDIPKWDIQRALNFDCTVLEMLVALSIRCEEIMVDSDEPDRTSHWFWTMINNLGLGKMDTPHFDEEYVKQRLDIFMQRRYGNDGSGGGLFVVPYPYKDLRRAEIWYQMNWYLDLL